MDILTQFWIEDLEIQRERQVLIKLAPSQVTWFRWLPLRFEI
jgi:hypothetical protein